MEGMDVERVVTQAHQQINLANAELGDEFYPVHHSVVPIDVAFTSRLNYFSQVVPVIDSYFARFGLKRTGLARLELSPVNNQGTLVDLLGHCETLGLDGIQEPVFWVPTLFARDHHPEFGRCVACSDGAEGDWHRQPSGYPIKQSWCDQMRPPTRARNW